MWGVYIMDYEKLYFLRKHTLLNPIDFIKISRMKAQAEKTQILINKLENCQIGVDFREADEYEYNARFKVWMHNLIYLWSKHSEGLDLYDFANLAIDQNLKKEKEELNNGSIRQRIK